MYSSVCNLSLVTGGYHGRLVIEDLWMDIDRDDYVFAVLQSLEAADLNGGRLASILVSGGVAVTDALYLGSFSLRASRDASGEFSIGAELGERASFLWTSENEPMRFAVHAATISVTKRRQTTRLGR